MALTVQYAWNAGTAQYDAVWTDERGVSHYESYFDFDLLCQDIDDSDAIIL